MPANWKFFRIICIVQIALSTLFLFGALSGLLLHLSFAHLARILTFSLAVALSALAITLLRNNWPATPVTGGQKKTFNWLFLLNFLCLAILFGIVIAEFRTMQPLLQFSGAILAFSISNFLLITFLLVFQLIILYGLYVLRRLLYDNFRKQQFEFEEK